MQAGEIVASVRDILQDKGPVYRYEDDSLLRLINRGMRESRRIRPDAWVGLYHKPVPAVSSLTDVIAMPELFFDALVNFVAGGAEMRDDEFTTDGRASALLNQFYKALRGQL